MKRFGLFGPPGVLSFDGGSGEEHANARVSGYRPPKGYCESLALAGL